MLETIPFHCEEGRRQTKDLGISADFGEKDLGIFLFSYILSGIYEKGDMRDDLQKKNLMTQT